MGTISQIDPKRFVVTNATLIRLITWAYGIRECRLEMGVVSGATGWMTSDRFDVQAVIPDGAPEYGRRQFETGEAPKLQLMLQNLMGDRFKLRLRYEMKEMAAYDLVIAKEGKLKASEDQTPPPEPYSVGPRGLGIALGPGGIPPRGITLLGNGVYQGRAISMSTLAQSLQAQSDRPVIDKTGLKGYFDIRVPVEFGADPTAPGGRLDVNAQILDGLGLKLESSRARIEVLVIDRAEKPTEN